jgi:hypothetical protein
VSEDPTIPADEPVEAAQSAPETTDAPPPWGEDFDAARAWQTITHQRKREAELETVAKEYERLKSDPDAQKEFLSTLGYEVEDDDDMFDEQPQENPEVAALKKQLEDLATWRDREEASRRESAFNADLDRLAEKAEVELDADDREWIAYRASKNGPENFTPEAVEAAFQALYERDIARAQTYGKRLKASKKAPVVAPAGQPATETKSITEMDPEAHRAYARELWQRRTQGG